MMKKALCILIALSMLLCLTAAESSQVTLDGKNRLELPDFVFHSLTATESGDTFIFTLTCESAKERTMSVFDPPAGRWSRSLEL